MRGGGGSGEVPGKHRWGRAKVKMFFLLVDKSCWVLNMYGVWDCFMCYCEVVSLLVLQAFFTVFFGLVILNYLLFFC